MKLAGRVGLVFGGASGIGRACAEALAAEGESVVVADPDVARGTAVVDGIRASGGTALFVESDITDEPSVEAAVRATVQEYGKLDTLVTSAGEASTGEGVWHRQIDLFLKGPYYATRHAAPEIARNGGGSIVHIGSLSSVRGPQIVRGDIEATGYPTAKHGVLGMSKTLALAYADQNIRVNVVCPGYIKTNLTKAMHESPDSEAFVKERLRVPLGRWGEPEDIGKVAAFLASDDAGYITGQAIVVDGGITAR